MFGEFCARDRQLEAFLEREFKEARKKTDETLEPNVRAEHINDFLNFGRALLRCNEAQIE